MIAEREFIARLEQRVLSERGDEMPATDLQDWFRWGPRQS